MENIRVREIVEAVNGRLLGGDMETPLRHISIDSRTMQGEDLFVPLIGERSDAHRFLNQAFDNGAAASLTSEHDCRPAEITGALIRVEDTKQALQDIGRYIRSRLLLPLVGITGSVGKTTTREMIAAALSAGYRTFKTPANYNGQVGVPITLSELCKTDEIGVLELGMSEPGEMEIIAGIARPDTAVITNIGVTHIENLGSRENILREKLHIQDGMKQGGTLFLNGDNDLLQNIRAKEGCGTVYYGLGESCDYRAANIIYHSGRPSFEMVHGADVVPVSLEVMGEHNILNALAALAVADYYRVDLEAAAAALGRFDGFENRQQVYEQGKITVIDDTYNASPDSMKAGIRVLSSFTDRRRRIAVLADMKELGENAPLFHREIGAFVAGQPVDEVVTYGTLAQKIAEGAEGKVKATVFEEGQREELAQYLKELLKEGDAVLFKGSNSMKLWDIASYFIKRGQTET